MIFEKAVISNLRFLKIKSIIDIEFDSQSSYEKLMQVLKYLLPCSQLIVACSGEYEEAKVMEKSEKSLESSDLAKELAYIADHLEEGVFRQLDNGFQKLTALNLLLEKSSHSFCLRSSVSMDGLFKTVVVCLGVESDSLRFMLAK